MEYVRDIGKFLGGLIMELFVKTQFLKSESSKAMLALIAAGAMVLALLNFKNNNLGMDVIDILNRVGIVTI